ncbi:DUF1211 domain-containing protein [Sphingomonas sinipercae]|uniref:DUF1211 domain-containing protein n=1 Tax=Sphingomonas sinipercae TaxID=2714944 RepID=A0A6G7ZMF1_9SPHN|nr:TMEM175 family protein [Sphingomonas sinipercae]QIL02113.1 DUF1211 domain-containing protein [Sphingomonas sinipercae]
MAGELESLHGNEPLAARIERHDYDRMVMLSDGVFAIAITLLALELPLPHAWDGRLQSLAVAAGPALLGYLFAFLIVGAFWLMHRRIYAQLLRVDRFVSVITLAILGLVGLSPFIARLVTEIGPTKGMVAYVALVSSVTFLQVVLWFYAMNRPGMIHAEVTAAERRSVLFRFGSIALVWGALALWAVLRDETLKGELIAAAAVISLAIRRLSLHLLGKNADSGSAAAAD